MKKNNKLEEIFLYHNVLKEICNKYENDLKPYFDPGNDYQRKMWNDITTKLSKAKTYYDIVFEEMENMAFSEVEDNFFTKGKEV
jgi:hypothetical protein